jgi:hypothetical protein
VRTGDREWLFSRPGGRRRGDERSFWRPCEGERSDEKVLMTMWLGEEVMKKVLTWIGRKVQWLFSDAGGCVGGLRENR